jgi:hypothetical protein
MRRWNAHLCVVDQNAASGEAIQIGVARLSKITRPTFDASAIHVALVEILPVHEAMSWYAPLEITLQRRGAHHAH